MTARSVATEIVKAGIRNDSQIVKAGIRNDSQITNGMTGMWVRKDNQSIKGMSKAEGTEKARWILKLWKSSGFWRM